MVFLYIIKLIQHEKVKLNLKKDAIVYILLMIILDVIAPILLMYGLSITSASNASLLNNFEIVMTSLIAFLIFKEKISFRLFLGIIIVTISCGILSFEGMESFTFSFGSIYILLAATCWGLENNCTRKISYLDPKFIVLLKGVFSGSISLVLGFLFQEKIEYILPIFASFGIGIVAYGLSIFFYVFAQRYIGAAKTSTYYAIAPFIATLLSITILKEKITIQFIVGLLWMMLGIYYVSSETPFDNLLHKLILNRHLT